MMSCFSRDRQYIPQVPLPFSANRDNIFVPVKTSRKYITRITLISEFYLYVNMISWKAVETDACVRHTHTEEWSRNKRHE